MTKKQITLTPAQQKKALALLKTQLEISDKAYSYVAQNREDDPELHDIRMFLISTGTIPDREKTMIRLALKRWWILLFGNVLVVKEGTVVTLTDHVVFDMTIIDGGTLVQNGYRPNLGHLYVRRGKLLV